MNDTKDILSDQTPSSKIPVEHAAKNESATAAIEKTQPWKQYLDEINDFNENNPLDKEFFECCEGFNDHSLAG